MSEHIFGFPTVPALELGKAIGDLSMASGGRFGGDDSMLKEMMGLLPIVERADAGEADPDGEGLAVLRGQSAGFVQRIGPYAEILAGFDNPRKTFVREVGQVYSGVLAAAASRQEEFGAGDVAIGLKEILGDLIENPEDEARRLPLLSEIVIARKRRPKPLKLPPVVILAVVAPEMLTALSAPLPKARQKRATIESVRRRPVAFTRIAEMLQGDQLRAIRAAAPVLLPTVRDLIPEKGSEVTERFEAVKEFLLDSPAV